MRDLPVTVNSRSRGQSDNHISLMRHTRPGESRRSNGEIALRFRVDSTLERTPFAWWTQVLELARAMARHRHRPPRHHRGPRPSGIAHLRPHHRTPQPTRRRRYCNDAINGDIRHHRTRASWSNGLSTRLKQWRAVATCYDNLALTYPAGFLLASIAEWLKPLGNMAQLDYRGCPMVRPAGPSQKCLQGRGAADSSGEQPQQQCHVGVHVKPPFGCGDGRTMFRRA